MRRYQSKPDYDDYLFQNNLSPFSIDDDLRFEKHLKNLALLIRMKYNYKCPDEKQTYGLMFYR